MKVQPAERSTALIKDSAKEVVFASHEYFRLAEEIGRLRLVEKLARCKPAACRQQDLAYFELLYEDLVDSLTLLRRLLLADPQAERHVNITLVHRLYLELFQEGSLRHLELVCRLTGLVCEGIYFDINEWLQDLLGEVPRAGCCKC